MNTFENTNNSKVTQKLICFDDNNEYTFCNSTYIVSELEKMGMAIGTAFEPGDNIVIGYSGSDSAKALTDSIVSGLECTGVNAYSLGPCTEQQIMFATCEFNVKSGCFISADFSVRISLSSKSGLPLKRYHERRIEDAYNNSKFRSVSEDSHGKSFDFHDTIILYENYLTEKLPDRFNGVLANVRCSSREMAVIADRVITSRNDIDGERVVFHISSDGKSCSAFSDKTGYIFHERLVMLAVKGLMEDISEIAVPFTFPRYVEEYADENKIQIFRYYSSIDDESDEKARRIAERHDNLFVRDGLALICNICSYLSDNGLSLYEAMQDIMTFTTVQRFVSYKGDKSDLENCFKGKSENFPEGIVYSKKETRAVIRPLKNRKGLMIFAEGFKSEQASAICDEIEEKLKKHWDTGK